MFGYLTEMPRNPKGTPSTAATVRKAVLASSDRYWRVADFDGHSPTAVARELSRLAGGKELSHVAKGLYYRPGRTPLGKSMPSRALVTKLTSGADLHPAGQSAANVLGLSTQNPAIGVFATIRSRRPTVVSDARVFTDRPVSRIDLTRTEASILEVLRDGARASDMDPESTRRRVVALMRSEVRVGPFLRAALNEPARVRAIVGALAQEAGVSHRRLVNLKKSLSPFSRFDFGALGQLRYARDWQAQ